MGRGVTVRVQRGGGRRCRTSCRRDERRGIRAEELLARHRSLRGGRWPLLRGWLIAARSLQRAEDALDRGALEVAREALSIAKEQDPDLPELQEPSWVRAFRRLQDLLTYTEQGELWIETRARFRATIDGEVIQRPGPRVFKLSPGRHRLKLRSLSSRRSAELSVMIESGERQVVRARFR